jgi:hypothetical protein
MGLILLTLLRGKWLLLPRLVFPKRGQKFHWIGAIDLLFLLL